MEKQPFGVLIIHGFASSLDSVNRLEVPLKNLGLPVRLPLLRGHGAPTPEALRGVTWTDWVADAQAALQALALQVEKVIVVGHSMGALMALTLAADQPAAIDSLVLAAAAIRLDSPLATGRALHFLVPLVRRVLKKWDLPPDYTDPSLAHYDTNYHWAPMDSISTFLELSDLTRRRLPEVHLPVLILQSRKDTAVAPISAEIILNGISTPAALKRIVWFERTGHEMFQDCEAEAVTAAVVDYVRQRAGLEAAAGSGGQ